jgi:lipid A 3-O-deacylase
MKLIQTCSRVALVAALFIAPLAHAQEVKKPAVVSLTVENDKFGGGTDRNYSNGLRIERVSGADEIFPALEWVADRIPFLDLKRQELRQGFALSHVIFTPEDKTLAVPDPTDRPYAGWLYASGTIVGTNGNTQDTLQVNLGIVGPSAGGEFVQNNFHRVIGVAEAQGWTSQLKDEPGLEIIAQRLYRFPGPTLPLGVETDLGFDLGGALGNVRTYASSGLTARIGWDLDSSFGPPRIRPALSGAGEFIPGTDENPMGGYFFVGVAGRAVGRDMFLDGNLFRDSPRVDDRKTYVGDLQAGLAIHYREVQLAFTYVNRTEEFDAQVTPQRFGAFSISVAR